MTRTIVHRADMSVGDTAAVIAGIVAVVVAFVTGLWSWMAGRKKANSDVQASLFAGFVLLLTQFKEERIQLVARIDKLEEINNKLEKHISKLESIMSKRGIELVEDGKP